MIERDIHSIAEIQEGIKEAFENIIQVIQLQDDERFEWQPKADKWCTGQQLDHLIRSVVPLNQGLMLPKGVIGLVFGKMNRQEYSYEEVLKSYHRKLDSGYKATGRFIPKWKAKSSKSTMLKKYDYEKHKLLRHLENWSEKDISHILLPHPVLGKLSVREMMFFTIHHNDHHLKQLEDIESYEKSN